MKRQILFGAIISVLGIVPLQAQEFGVYTGVQVVRGELTEYSYSPSSITSINAFWDIPEAPNWRYGGEIRYASMTLSPSIEDGWLQDYRAEGNDFSVMMSMRYYYNTPGNFYKRRNSFLVWSHFGVGFHAMNFQSTAYGAKGLGSTNKTQLSESRSAQAGALELGSGMQYYFDDHWSITLVGGVQYTGNDYLDGVSGIGDGEDWPVYAMLGGSYRLF
ncbi:MAG: hypothetical protein HWE14_01220 [Flavobacteriia bacterium]|nr:hypothetical protein [Flavobacteriia bacterium]